MAQSTSILWLGIGISFKSVKTNCWTNRINRKLSWRHWLKTNFVAGRESIKPNCGTSCMKIGVLIINLGTPDEPTPKSVGRYLKQFLMDKWVVDIPFVLRWI